MEHYILIIRELREKHQFSQRYVANYLDISQTMYSRYECCKTELPVRHLIKLCELYHVPTDFVLGSDLAN